MIYQKPKRGKGRSNYQSANNVFEMFQEGCRQLGMKVEEPYWIELENEGDMTELEDELQHYLTKDGQYHHPCMIVMVLGQEHLYDKHKNLYKQYQIPSQVVTTRNAFKFNLSKASNVLK